MNFNNLHVLVVQLIYIFMQLLHCNTQGTERLNDEIYYDVPNLQRREFATSQVKIKAHSCGSYNDFFMHFILPL